ncbi:MAG: hypothetical protein ACRDRX_01910 [Pseudonocardiaceae bacterium]
MIKLLDAAIGRVKVRDRGVSGGQLLVGLACTQLTGEDFLVGLDRQRADVAGQVLAPVAGLSSTTAAGLARRLAERQWRAMETGIGEVHTAMLAALPAARAAALCEEVTIDLDTTDVEVYERKKRGVASNSPSGWRGDQRGWTPARCSPGRTGNRSTPRRSPIGCTLTSDRPR